MYSKDSFKNLLEAQVWNWIDLQPHQNQITDILNL